MFKIKIKYLFVLAYELVMLSNAIELDQTALFETFAYSHDSVYIDLSGKSIESIQLSTFSGLNNLEVLHLEDNKLKRIENGMFNDLFNLKELWLESNTLISIDKEAFLGLNNLELVCLNENPLQELFPNQLAFLCDSNPKCVIKITEKCLIKSTFRPNTTLTNEKFKELDDRIINLEAIQQSNNETIRKLLDKMDNLLLNFNGVNTKIDSITNRLNDLNKTNINQIAIQQANNQSLIALSSKFEFFSNELNDFNKTLSSNYMLKKKIYSLAHDVSINEMISQGYRIAYDFPYSHPSTYAELQIIKLQCSAQTILCAGGAAKGSDNLLLVSCGNCQSILTPTPVNQPQLINGAYWYYTNQTSFGFAPIYKIIQGTADNYGCDDGTKPIRFCQDNKRLSWHLHAPHDNGGWRLGLLTRLYDDTYRKIILLF